VHFVSKGNYLKTKPIAVEIPEGSICGTHKKYILILGFDPQKRFNSLLNKYDPATSARRCRINPYSHIHFPSYVADPLHEPSRFSYAIEQLAAPL